MGGGDGRSRSARPRSSAVGGITPMEFHRKRAVETGTAVLTPPAPPAEGLFSEATSERYRRVRGFTEQLCAPLAVEDYVVQSMADVSPAKWHLAHTTWFFETFVLEPATPDYQPFHPLYRYLFNSYYNTVGDRYPRPRRGLLSRPTVAEV